jgi:hypothetical protein
MIKAAITICYDICYFVFFNVPNPKRFVPYSARKELFVLVVAVDCCSGLQISLDP